MRRESVSVHLLVAPRLAARRSLLIALASTSLAAAASPAAAADYYVAPDGAPGNSGAIEAPLDLATALSRTSPARPGDTIWLRGGTYYGTFTSYLQGTASAPIVVRQYPGERATLDGNGSSKVVLTVHGSWTIYWGFEVTNSHPQRLSSQTGSWPSDLYRGFGVDAHGTNLKFVNLVVHDTSQGFGVWSNSVGTEVYGSIIYHNGWQAPDRAHGHGIYTQNQTGARLIRDNILFNQFSHGIHAYGSSAAYLDNITLEGNVAFNNGILATDGYARDLLLGGGRVAQNPVVRENYTYGGGQTNIGYAAGCTNAAVTGNYFNGSGALLLVNCAGVVSGNTIYSPLAATYGYPGLEQSYPNNTYYRSRPADAVVVVRPNLYEPGRAHVVIYNWPRRAAVPVDLSRAGLRPGDAFEIRDAQNFFGPPVVTGTYTGAAVHIPMYALPFTPPVGNVPVQPAHTGPEFGVFVVLPAGSSPSSAVAAPLIEPSGGTFASAVEVSLASATPEATIRYTTDGSAPTSASPLYTGPFVLTASGTVHARAFKTGMPESAISSASFTIAGGGGARAAFLGADDSTKGSWHGVYGGDGSIVVGGMAAPPAYAQVGPAGHGAWTWARSTGDVRALEDAGTRVAATWFSGTSFTIDIRLADAQPHRAALYAVDWDSTTRRQRVEVLDAATGAVLDSREMGGFSGGRYLVWELAGHVRLRVTRLAGANAVVSGLFFGPATAPGGSAAARFLAADDGTKGSWRGVYGSDGSLVIGGTAALPAYARVSAAGQSSYTWVGSTADVRALQAGTTRVAATWFAGTSFTIDVRLTDGHPHRVALYAVDWDSTARRQRVEVLDAATGDVLDSREMGGFNGGRYLVWELSGHVRLRVTKLAGANAVVSGLFFDGP
jgi:hypothetical protein